MRKKLAALVSLPAAFVLAIVLLSEQAHAQTNDLAVGMRTAVPVSVVLPALKARADHVWHKFRADVEMSVKISSDAPSPEHHGGLFHKMLWYFPNRMLDIVDIFRARVRVGPGLAMGVRATADADAFIGRYDSIFLGLPGPRMRPHPRWPLGPESASDSMLETLFEIGDGPGYSPTEFGASVHFLILGFDLGLDPVEFGDFFTGLFCIDIRDDDH